MRLKAANIFDAWQKKLTDLYIEAGVDPDIATDFSFELISASEGAVVVARAQKSLVPFEAVAKRLILSI